MAESTPAQIVRAPKRAAIPFEQQLYLRSPLGTLATTGLVFAAMFGSFLAIAAFNHVTTITRTANGIAFSSAAWPALVVSLLCCAALAMQRFARQWEDRDAPAFARILTGGAVSAAQMTELVPRDARLWRATVLGLCVGLAISAAVVVSEIREGHTMPPGPFVWFVCGTTFANLLFARGLEQTRAASRAYAQMLESELKIDLLRIDRLAVLGRSAARAALIWFVISAVACLFFVGGDLNWLTIALIVSCAAIGIAMFVGTMSRIHRQIKTAKDAELEHLRHQIDALRATLHTNGDAAGRMHGLLAYEKRIADTSEWPFDQPTLVRVAAYILIPTIPWFGQAMVQYFVDHLGH
jgi:hypothetical protein